MIRVLDSTLKIISTITRYTSVEFEKNFNDYGTESFQFRRTEINMVGVRSQLGIIRQENLCQIAPLPEYVIDMTARIWIPAVLRAETGYLSFVQPFVKLLFYRACSE